MNEKLPYYMFWLLLFFIIVTVIALLFAMAKSASIEKIPFLKTEVNSGKTVLNADKIKSSLNG